MNNRIYGNRFWLRWILNYAFGELLVIGAATAFGRLVLIELSDFIDQSPALVVWLLLATVGVAEGWTIGYFQWHSLNRLLVCFKSRPWIFATIAATTIGWLVIMPPSIFLMAFFVDFHLINKYYSVLYALFAGTAFGGIIGIVQYLILRRYYNNAVIWIFSNILSWMFSFFVICQGVSMLSSGHTLTYNLMIMVFACIFSGLAQGLVTGISLHFLMSMKKANQCTHPG